MFTEYNDMMTISEVCEALMIGRNRCYHLLNDASIKGFRIGGVWKVPKEAVIDYVRESSAARSLTETKPKRGNKMKSE